MNSGWADKIPAAGRRDVSRILRINACRFQNLGRTSSRREKRRAQLMELYTFHRFYYLAPDFFRALLQVGRKPENP